MLKVGITERGDPSLDFSWVRRLQPEANIIISKNLNNELIEALMVNKSVCIFHCTCTGWGGTFVEPNVPTSATTYCCVQDLISAGFPVKQIVLRVDPILPSKTSLQKVSEVLRMFKQTGISRVRYSYMDLYPHVVERFAKVSIDLSGCKNFPTDDHKEAFKNLFAAHSDVYTFESCAEFDENKVGCISQKDLDILGVKERLEGRKNQRSGCLCPANKIELLERPKRCLNGCLYCYWWDK